MPDNKFTDDFEEADRAFNNDYSVHLEQLKGLSEEEIASLTPGTTSKEVYEKLITVVQEATDTNMKQADLIDKIKSLGEIAVNIAKKVPYFASLL